MENKKRHLISRLKQLDYDEQLVDVVIEKIMEGNVETARLLLRRHRKTLMDDLHESEKKIDDLDLLIYQIQKNKL